MEQKDTMHAYYMKQALLMVRISSTWTNTEAALRLQFNREKKPFN